MRGISSVFFAILMWVCLASASAAQVDITQARWSAASDGQKRGFFNSTHLEQALSIHRETTKLSIHNPVWHARARIYRLQGGWTPEHLNLYFLRMPNGKFMRLDGSARPFLELQKQSKSLPDYEQSPAYLWAFGFFVREDGVPLLFPESRTAGVMRYVRLPKSAGSDGGAVNLDDAFEPITCRPIVTAISRMQCDATLLHKGGLFRVTASLGADGAFQITGGRQLVAGLRAKVDLPINPKYVANFKPKSYTPPPKVVSKADPPKPRVTRRVTQPSTSSQRQSSSQTGAGLPPPINGLSSALGQTLAAIARGETVRLNRENIPFLAGMASAMAEKCNMPRNRAARIRLARFAATSTVGAMAGFDFSSKDLGKSVGSAWRQQSLLASGALAVNAMGCSPALERVGVNMAKLIEGNDAGGSGFVSSCAGRHGQRKCTCIANTARQVIPDIASRRYSPRLMQEVIQRNPFVAMMLIGTCGVTQY